MSLAFASVISRAQSATPLRGTTGTTAPERDTSPITADTDTEKQLTVTVRIDGNGPYRFVVDTGADRTVLATDVAAELGLMFSENVMLEGVVRAVKAETVTIRQLSFGAVRYQSHRHEEEGHKRRESARDVRERIEGFWDYLPHTNRVTFVRNGLVRFEDIAVIDEKGDSEFQFPHIFVDFHSTNGPFVGFYEYLRIHEHRHVATRDLKRVKRFPATFDKPRLGKVHAQTLSLPNRVARFLSGLDRSQFTLYDVEGRFDFLAETDVIAIEGSESKGRSSSEEPMLIQITHKQSVSGRVLLGLMMEDPGLKHRVEEQVGREVLEADQVRIVEFKRTYRWALEQAGSNLPNGMDERLGRQLGPRA